MFVRSTSRALYETARNGCRAVQAEFPPLPPRRRPAGGEFWHLPAGTLYPDELHLENDFADHWSWEPAQDMEMAHYRALLATLGRNFRVIAIA
jgi:hypothetical protein